MGRRSVVRIYGSIKIYYSVNSQRDRICLIRNASIQCYREPVKSFENPRPELSIKAIGVQLFNRFDIAQRNLLALRRQSFFSLDDCAIFILIDKDESHSENEIRENIYSFAKEVFPLAQFILPEQNLGIAKSFLLLQATVFKNLGEKDWAFFIEEDIILESLHMCLLQRFINSLDNSLPVHRVSLFQGVYDQENPTLPFDIAISEGTKAFALTKFAHLKIFDKFTHLVEVVNANVWTRSHKFAVLLANGLHLPAHSKDFIFDECLRTAGFLSLHWNIGLAKDIGFIGHGGSTWENLSSNRVRSEPNDFDSQDALSHRIQYKLPLLKKEQENIVIRRALRTEEALLKRDSIKSTAKHLLKLLNHSGYKLLLSKKF